MALWPAAPRADDLNADEIRALRQQGVIRPFQEFLDAAMARYPGASLLEAELEKEQGQLVYEIELLTEGLVRELSFDARTGRLLKDEED